MSQLLNKGVKLNWQLSDFVLAMELFLQKKLTQYLDTENRLECSGERHLQQPWELFGRILEHPEHSSESSGSGALTEVQVRLAALHIPRLHPGLDEREVISKTKKNWLIGGCLSCQVTHRWLRASSG